ncbi:MotA/TolQ/ExbB proton channel family protein [Roseimaritima ulvae]|uniref:Colicin uptake protein TolQ n=1 Tax=Roseimaritima ulvae TaxID=980254 RepID=A0A5B9R0K0_9BACT|nr:MotA/TolQ/ExbB proton channel family protein [Roseimaritima ulvae]QEG43255.1 colicin uptake protein TolQ [Roseimaritima ulvae]
MRQLFQFLRPSGADRLSQDRGGLTVRAALWVVVVAVAVAAGLPASVAQDVPIDASAIEALQGNDPADNLPSDAERAADPTGIDLMTLIGSGGKFMIPIAIMSLLVVTLSVERFVSMRRRRVIPKRLVEHLMKLRDPVESFDPQSAYNACEQNPSAAATVVKAMLERTGQPLGEIERAAIDTAQREADDYGGPIRWLNLAAAATPLMGLLGTVWGMIVAFHESTSLTADRSRSEQLSEGIYTALVTTLAGLIVAIPAAIMAQYLENRLTKLFHRIEELAFAVAPGLERFHGRMRFDTIRGLRPLQPGAKPPPPPAPPLAGHPNKQPRVSSEQPVAKKG